MLQQAIFVLGLIAISIGAQSLTQNLEQNIAQNDGQNLLPNDSPRTDPPQEQQQQQQQPQQQQLNDVQQFTLQAMMQISNGTEKFSLELYKVKRPHYHHSPLNQQLI